MNDLITALTEKTEEDIALGVLKPRERLIEDDFMKKHGIKRHAARQVISALEQRGIVVKERNRGASVRDFSPDEVEQIYEVRVLLERRAMEVMPLPAPKNLIKNLKKIQISHKTAAEQADVRKVFRENIRFHHLLFSSCGNGYLARSIDQYAQLSLPIRSHTILVPGLLERAIEEHAEMISAIECNNRELLCRIVTEHLLPSKETYLQQFSLAI